MGGVLTFAIALWKFGNPPGLQFPKWELIWECEFSFSLSLSLLLACALANLYFVTSPMLGLQHYSSPLT